MGTKKEDGWWEKFVFLKIIEKNLDGLTFFLLHCIHTHECKRGKSMPRHDPSEKTKSEILQTAVRLFTEKGWENVNVEDVVKEVGVTRGAFYHYFKSREDLIMAVVDKMFYENNPFTTASRKKGLNALEKLRFVLKQNFHNNYDNSSMAREVHNVVEKNPTIFKSEFLSQLNTICHFG